MRAAAAVEVDRCLAPLLPLLTAQDADIRRQAICSLALLADVTQAPAVVALRCGPDGGTSLVRCLLGYARATEPLGQRRDAVGGFASLCRSHDAHTAVIREGLLPDAVNLVRTAGIDVTLLRGALSAIAHLCEDAAVAPKLQQGGASRDLARLTKSCPDPTAQRRAAAALAALSRHCDVAALCREAGMVEVVVEMMAHEGTRDDGAELACNLCLHADNGELVADGALLCALLHSASTAPHSADADVAAAFAALCTRAPLLPALVRARAPEGNDFVSPCARQTYVLHRFAALSA